MPQDNIVATTEQVQEIIKPGKPLTANQIKALVDVLVPMDDDEKAQALILLLNDATAHKETLAHVGMQHAFIKSYAQQPIIEEFAFKNADRLFCVESEIM